jgi:hypothetical protein
MEICSMREANRPLVAERINDCRHSIIVNNVGWFLEGSCASSHSAPVNKIDIGKVCVERAASWQTCFFARAWGSMSPHLKKESVGQRSLGNDG